MDEALEIMSWQSGCAKQMPSIRGIQSLVIMAMLVLYGLHADYRWLG